MAQRPSRGRCVHCLKPDVERTWDHVFPRAWYPDTTPPNLHKWQIPSCLPCNSEYGALEGDLLTRLGLCLDPHAADTASIAKKALRSLKPEHGKSGRDRDARTARAKRLGSQFLDGPRIPRSAVYPGFGERWGRPATEGLGVPIPVDSLRRFTEKIVRGIYYLEDGKFIEPPQTIQFYALTEEGAEPVKTLLVRHGKECAREPGIVVRRAVPDDDLTIEVFEITIWQQFKMYATASQPDSGV